MENTTLSRTVIGVMRIDSPSPQRPHGRGIILLVCTVWIAALVSPGLANGQEQGPAAGAVLAVRPWSEWAQFVDPDGATWLGSPDEPASTTSYQGITWKDSFEQRDAGAQRVAGAGLVDALVRSIDRRRRPPGSGATQLGRARHGGAPMAAACRQGGLGSRDTRRTRGIGQTRTRRRHGGPVRPRRKALRPGSRVARGRRGCGSRAASSGTTWPTTPGSREPRRPRAARRPTSRCRSA